MFDKELVGGLYEKAGLLTPENIGIVNHNFGVADVAGFLARKLDQWGVNVDIELVETVGALHDIGKGIEDGPEHSIKGADFLRQEDVDERIVEIVRRHEFCYFERGQIPEPETWEQKLVFLADYYFGGEIVDMWERIEDVIARCPEAQEEWLRGSAKKIYQKILDVIQIFPF